MTRIGKCKLVIVPPTQFWIKHTHNKQNKVIFWMRVRIEKCIGKSKGTVSQVGEIMIKNFKGRTWKQIEGAAVRRHSALCKLSFFTNIQQMIHSTY